MTINATDEKIIRMGQLAILHSKPMGIGFLHYQPNKALTDYQLEIRHNSLHIDYYEGRMVKFHTQKNVDGWDFQDEISSEYQSWNSKYNSYQALYEAAVDSLNKERME
jgi:hypothetical protein